MSLLSDRMTSSDEYGAMEYSYSTPWDFRIMVKPLVLQLKSICCGYNLTFPPEAGTLECMRCQRPSSVPDERQSWCLWRDFDPSITLDWVASVPEPLDRVLAASELYQDLLAARRETCAWAEAFNGERL